MSETVSARNPGASFPRDQRLAFAEGPRALAEFASLIPAAPYLAFAPRGDGHPVLVLPGYGGGDGSTVVIRRYLANQGFVSAGWTLGRNLGPSMPDLQQRLTERLLAVWSDGGQRRVSLVGWSLGGVYARLLAQLDPDRIRQVITLGSPIGGRPQPSRAYRVMRRVSDGGIDRDEAMRLRVLASDPLAVPGSAVYSRTDGIVPWQIARQTASAIADNIEVYGSHIGLGFNPSTLFLLAERLAQGEDRWRPFDRRGWRRWVYGPGEAT
jgi:pimeloyl-ACP methyl ester carboxylesterase